MLSSARTFESSLNLFFIKLHRSSGRQITEKSCFMIPQNLSTFLELQFPSNSRSQLLSFPKPRPHFFLVSEAIKLSCKFSGHVVLSPQNINQIIDSTNSLFFDQKSAS